jgi:hypothetical protein
LSASLKTKVKTKLGADPKRIKPTGERQERQLSLNPLLLRLEGGTRGGRCLLQLEDDGVFFLTSLTQLLIGHTLLDQLAQEPRDFLVLELEGGLRLLQRGALPLELALRFLSGRTLAVEGGLSLLEGGPLLLELGLRLLARAPLLLELLLHRGK